ncbi:hypothetical protein [Rhizobium leguminosarum]
MVRAPERNPTSLELETVAAHRAYIDALAAWDHIFHLASCSICRPEGVSDEEHGVRCASAEMEKERRRVVFRDLCDELGYVPSGHGVKLSPTQKCCPRQSVDF